MSAISTLSLVPRLVLYGPSKVGKTTAAASAAFNGVCIAASGALDPLQTHLGLTRDQFTVEHANTFADILRLLPALKARKPKVVYVDDLSLAILRQQNGQKMDWNKLDRDLLQLSDTAEEYKSMGIPFIVTCHEQPQRLSSGKYIRGGPQLPGQAPEKFSGMFDVVLRAVSEETMEPWPFCVWSRSRRDWIAGDRLSIFPDCGPLNIAEGLRARGVDLPPPVGLEWMAKATHTWAEAIYEAGIATWKDTLRERITKLQGKLDPRHIRWAASDAIARTVLRIRSEDTTGWLDSRPTIASDLIVT